MREFFSEKILTILCIVCVLGWSFFIAYSHMLEKKTYPSRHIEIICSFSAGGGSDLLCRAYASEFSKNLGVLMQKGKFPVAAFF